MLKKFLTGSAALALVVATMWSASSAAPKSAFARFIPSRGGMMAPNGHIIPLTGFVAGMLASHVHATNPTGRKPNGPLNLRARGLFDPVTHIIGTFPANEPSLAVDPIVSAHMFASANDYRLGFDSSPGLYRTFTGTTGWTDGITQYVISGPYYYNAAGDPAVGSDRPSHEFVGMIAFNRFAISGGFPQNSVLVGRANFFTGDQFVDPVPANVDTEAIGNLNDKDSLTTDNGTDGNFSGSDYISWTRITPNNSPIVLSWSHPPGFGCQGCWSPPVLVSRPGGTYLCPLGQVPGACADNTGASVAIGRNGTVWVAYENFDSPGVKNQILIAKSIDGGLTFSHPVLVAQDTPISNPIGFFRVNSFPNLAVNRTTGRLYVAWADGSFAWERILITSSLTGAAGTWSAAKTAESDAPTAFHFFPAIAVNPGNGRVYVSFYTNGRNPGQNLYDYDYHVFAANLVPLNLDHHLNAATIDPSFGGFGGFFFGDYTSAAPIQSLGSGACFAWTDDNATVGEENIQNSCIP